MNAYGRYVHIFFGVILMIPLLIAASEARVFIVAFFGALAVICAVVGLTLIIRALVAPSLPVASEKKRSPSP